MRFGVFDPFSQKPYQNLAGTFQEMATFFATFGSPKTPEYPVFGFFRFLRKPDIHFLGISRVRIHHISSDLRSKMT